MTQSLPERLNYHPDPRRPGRSDRRVAPRLDLIRSKVPCQGATILDLGCSGGIFAFEFAKVAKWVIAVDGDAEVIARNKEIQRELGVRNIEFTHAAIDADLVRSLGAVDVTLMLSVYHHMLTHSAAYDWNAAATTSASESVLDAIADQTGGTFVFEVGYPNEGYEWCARLPDFGPDWDAYVRRTVFRNHYASVEACRPDYRMRWVNRAIISRLSRPYREDGTLVQRIKSAVRFDARDFRKVYIGKKPGRSAP